MRLKTSNQITYKAAENAILLEVDYERFIKQATALIQSDHDEESKKKWALFCKHIHALKERKPEKLMLLQVAWRCFANPLSNADLAQFITLSGHLKSLFGAGLYRQLLEAAVPESNAIMDDYVLIMQLLIELHEQNDLKAVIKANLPNLKKLYSVLQDMHGKYLESKYAKRNIDAVLARFATIDEITPCPLGREKLAEYKIDYLGYEAKLKEIRSLPQEKLKALFLETGKLFSEKGDRAHKQMLLAIMAETIRRVFKILPYDTQILALLALLDNQNNIEINSIGNHTLSTREKFAILDNEFSALRGHLAQIKTGEGKSTIDAIINAFLASQGRFVDFVAPNPYLAIRDCEKYQPFYQALGLTASHICHKEQEPEHFNAHILFGTNSDFEFAILRDKLNRKKLRLSCALGETELKSRPFDVIVVDEVDNMMLDTSGAARIAIPGDEDISWIYGPILEFVASKLKNNPIVNENVTDLRKFLETRLGEKRIPDINKMPHAALLRRLKSAQIASYRRLEMRDYVVKSDIVIVDRTKTGRMHEGSQWQHGIHQFLQAKHQLKITPESLTSASISHPSFFNSYKTIFGLTGTMGEQVERDEIKEIYKVDSFDIPPHYPSQRITLPPRILTNAAEQTKALIQMAKEMQTAGRPILILFESIKESNDFSAALHASGLQHQLLNEQQRESEDYIVARAGEAGMITVATNVAARGTDIILSPESKQAGGLHQIFAFYPENSRVDGQGFGRAGRQGQPGSCCMVLYYEDPRIKALLQPNPGSDLLMELAYKTDSERVKYLNELRTLRIQDESKERRYTAQLESLYYQCLDQFSTKLQQLYDNLYDKKFENELQKICKSEIQPSINQFSINEKEQPWITIYQYAIDLLKNQSAQKMVDWSSFIEQFKESYTEFVLKRWGQFYSRLTDQVNSLNILVAAQNIQQSYTKFIENDLYTATAVMTILRDLFFKAFLQLHAQVSHVATTTSEPMNANQNIDTIAIMRAKTFEYDRKKLSSARRNNGQSQDDHAATTPDESISKPTP